MMKEKILYVWFQTALGICNRLSGEILSRFGSIAEVYNCNDFSFIGEKYEKYINRLENKDTSQAFEILKRCESLGIQITGYYDLLYPKSLRKIKSPPAVLYSIGNFKNLNDTPCVAIVGTRKMTDYGKNITESFAYNFSKSGAFVISGLAKGVDTAAHRGAVMADGYTVAVLGNPIGDVYPKENVRAFETLYKRGLVISEMYPGCPRTRGDFPNRNRIISGISDCVVVAEAGENSGALITAKHALEQGKPVYAVPGAIGAENAGTNKLIKTGVPAVTEAFDVLSPLSLEYPEKIKFYNPEVTSKLRSYGNVQNKKPKREEIVKIIMTENEEAKTGKDEFIKENMADGSVSQKIINALKDSKPMTADEIAEDIGADISTVMTELTFLEIDGTVIASAGSRFTLSKLYEQQ